MHPVCGKIVTIEVHTSNVLFVVVTVDDDDDWPAYLTRLRSWAVEDLNDGVGRAAQVRRHSPRLPRVDDLRTRERLVAQRHRHALGVSVEHRHAVACRRDAKRRKPDLIAGQLAKYLERLGLQLRFLFVDVRNHVAHDVETRYARIAGARDRLHRHDVHALDAELGERSQNRRQASRAAIRVCNNRSAIPSAFLSLRARIRRSESKRVLE
jgi:hypothetical protein